MTEFVRLLVEIAQWAFPLRAVENWERGCYYVLGRHWWGFKRFRGWPIDQKDGTVGPGRWPVVPYFMDVRACVTVPTIFKPPLQRITLRDQRSLAFRVAVMVCVVDAAKATNSVERWDETTWELVSGVIGDRLADVDPDRFDPARGKRNRLVEELRQECNQQSLSWGVEIQQLWFTDFVVGAKTYNLLLSDGGALGASTQV